MSETLSDSAVRKVARNIIEEYRAGQAKFAEYDLPEYEVIGSFSDEGELATFLTFTTSINFNQETTGEGGVWQKCKRLYESDRYDWVFDPDRIAEMNGTDLYDEIFRQIGLRGSAPGIWCDVGKTLQRDVGGDVLKLLDKTNDNAQTLKKHLQEEEYPSLRRKKVGHLWLRLIDEEVRSLTNIDEIAIPVDRHIVTVTEELRQETYSRDSDDDLAEIRDFWQRICETEDYYPVEIDKPLWLIGKNWDKWGKQYTREKITAVE